MTDNNGQELEILLDSILDDQSEYDKSVGKLLGLFICIDVVNLAIKQTQIVPSGGLSYILGIVFVLFVLHERRILFSVNGLWKLFCMESIFVVLVLVTCMRFSGAISAIVSRCIYTAMFCVPFYFFSRRVKSRYLMIQQTVIPSIIVLILSGFVYFYLRRHPGNDSYNMTIGYALLYPASLFWTNRKEKKRFYFLFVITVALIFVMGSRGPMLCLLILVTLQELSNWKTVNELIRKAILAIALLIFFLFLRQILQLISNAFALVNIYSRNLTMILNGIIASDSGRSTVYDIVKETIHQSPIIGYGIAGDAAVLGYYPHNLFLELIFHFGYPVGILLSAVVCLKVALNLKQRNQNERNTLYIFLSCGLIPLFMSGTYLQTPLFWIMLGLCSRRVLSLNLICDRMNKNEDFTC